MTFNELLETVPVEVKNAIEEICEMAGTYDADWEVLKAAGELLVKHKRENERMLQEKDWDQGSMYRGGSD